LKRTGGAPNGERDRAKPQGKAAGVVSLGLQFACSNANVLKQNPNRKTKGGERYRRRCFLFADLAGVRFFSARRIFVSWL